MAQFHFQHILTHFYSATDSVVNETQSGPTDVSSPTTVATPEEGEDQSSSVSLWHSYFSTSTLADISAGSVVMTTLSQTSAKPQVGQHEKITTIALKSSEEDENEDEEQAASDEHGGQTWFILHNCGSSLSIRDKLVKSRHLGWTEEG